MNRLLGTLASALLTGVTVTAQTSGMIRLQWTGYDNNAKAGGNGTMSFTVNGTAVRMQPPQDKTVPGTGYRIVKFSLRERVDLATGKKTDLSELELVHAQTKRKMVVVLGKAVEVPEK